MKRGVLKFTACALAAGMTFGGTGSVAFAGWDEVLIGFGAGSSVNESGKEEQTGVSASEVNEPESAAAETAASGSEAASETVESGTDTVEEQTAASASAGTEAEETETAVDTSMSGETAFAQCEQYINIRSDASIEGEVLGKIYNNGSVTILSQVGDWYEVQSGNVTGYVKAEYFATGAEADEIAEEVGYNVATVYAEALYVRADASEDAETVGMVYSTDQLEVVQYDGDWMKVVLDDGTYGYVNAYYVGYDTYYATAETLEEEQARLDQQWLDYLAEQEAERAAAEQAYLDAIAAQEAEAAAAAASYTDTYTDTTYTDTYTDTSYTGTGSSASEAQAAADAAYQEYLDAQAAADAATMQADVQAVYDTAAEAQAEYQEFLAAQAIADAAAQAEANAAYQAAASYTEETYTDTSYTEPTYTEETYTEETAAEETYTQEPAAETPTSSLGQQIADYAVQFVGNPYVYGGTSLTNGADCSGFTQSVFAHFGIGLSRTAASQSSGGTPIDLSSIQPGDLLFYSDGGSIGHVTMYIGGGQVVHASSSTTGIIISSYGYRTPVCARRYW